MNRLKLWAFALLVLLAGALNLHLTSQWLARAAVAEADRALRAAAGQLDARSRLLAAQAAALADVAARAPAVLAALSGEEDGDATAAAALAVAAATRGAGPGAAPAPVVGTAGPSGAALRLAGKPVELQDPAGGLFAGPLRGVRSEGYARIADGLWFVAAVPAGKGAVAVGVPVGAAWVQTLHAETGAEVVLLAGPARPLATIAGRALADVTAAARAPQPAPVDAGRLGAVPAALPGSPALPLLVGRLPALRVQVVALKGMTSGLAALALPMERAAAPLVTYQAVSLAVLLLLLLAGLFLGLLIAPEAPSGVPRELVAAADRIGRGDFSARVAPLAGSLGTVASALNRAAEAADQGREAQALAGPPPAAISAAPEPDPFAFPPRPAAPPDEPPPPAPPTPEPLELEPRPPPPAAEPAAPEPLPPQPQPPARLQPLNDSVSGATSLTTRPEDLLATGGERREPAPSPAPPADTDERHWRQVYDEFLRVREACGEPNEGLSFDRFEAKLQANRAALVRKHACRTVRFQVYVKEGRAALKATPVR